MEKSWLKFHSSTQNTTNVCHNQNQPQSEIEMWSYYLQDVYNHVCRICHPIKHERHYHHLFHGAHWNTVTFRESRQTEPTQSPQWSASPGHTNTDHPQLILLLPYCFYHLRQHWPLTPTLWNTATKTTITIFFGDYYTVTHDHLGEIRLQGCQMKQYTWNKTAFIASCLNWNCVVDTFSNFTQCFTMCNCLGCDQLWKLQWPERLSHARWPTPSYYHGRPTPSKSFSFSSSREATVISQCIPGFG